MCTFKITNNPNSIIIDDYLKLGGPDASNTIDVNGVYITHHLSSITGKDVVQPYKHNNKYYILIGEIYNRHPLFSSIFFCIDKYLEYGDKFTEYLDGEFLFIIYDEKTDTIDLFTDPWSTKQAFYYKIDDYFYFSTFPMTEPKGGRFGPPGLTLPFELKFAVYNDTEWNKTFYRIPHNSHHNYNVKTGVLEPVNTELHKWDLNQYKDNLDDLTNSFEEAVLKRYIENSTLLLSSGLDSTPIALCLADHKKHFNSISCLSGAWEGAEDVDKLNQVIQYTGKYNKNIKIESIPDYDISWDEINLKSKWKDNRKRLECANLSLRTQWFMREKCISEFNSKVIFTGNGGDEVFDNYPALPEGYPLKFNGNTNKNSSGFSIWPEDLSTVFPWQHFYGGQARRLLDLFETLSLAYGLENRNVFYDKKLVQEWLHVMPWIKNQTPKVLQKKYLHDRGIKVPV
jgi:asparagine synthetase B (glutamine-hydrolysing)